MKFSHKMLLLIALTVMASKIFTTILTADIIHNFLFWIVDVIVLCLVLFVLIEDWAGKGLDLLIESYEEIERTE